MHGSHFQVVREGALLSCCTGSKSHDGHRNRNPPRGSTVTQTAFPSSDLLVRMVLRYMAALLGWQIKGRSSLIIVGH